MRNHKKKMRISNPNHMPLHLCEEILARLPVKDLLRFRCVCKSWRLIIDSSVFTDMHLNLYNKRYQHKNYLVLCADYNSKPTLCLCYINKFRQIDEQIVIHLPKGRLFVVVGSCKGLLLIKHETKTEETRLWNFSIRKSLLLPRCPISNHVQYVVGFSPSSNDYKVVAFTCNSIVSKTVSIAVYSLRDHRWKVKSNTKIMNSKWHVPRQLRCDDVIFVENAAYWFEFRPNYRDWYKNQQVRIVSFDFDAEEINLLELPDQVAGKEIIARFLCSIDDSLAVFSLSTESSCVWILEKDRGNSKTPWRPWYSWKTNFDFGELFRGNIYHWLPSKTIYLQNSNTFFMKFKNQLMSYNTTSHEFRHVSKRFYGNVDTYAESLVSHTDLKWRDDGLVFP
ncbi:F-box/kelch-repeat protein At3g23880-like isoform X2 [Spinacia oleracea]|uniref:F-box/kelch-repeat protein At3g23880-like n=1 Tax=Spinacia oleracea TaxID=3562 RepID=A0A9R0IMY3_SPIOL|nr:F-box/kelch-repeat protein At3g23880-like isoform X2 [Spinacia oleracea]XP_056699710.1 F-box/kelch-repeat protein At3g23880-like isoform X2 [Spinacia oleracea]